ncbi:indole-3-glycerol phosphate synthase [Lactobacillus coryniformis subsp. torquens DSM = KCTC 3535] [Lactiplantibacillus mudanjiangensis]|uniref:indole-3-glycerol phosphate synthase TrpC n=1 Tax=Lactiplantibacillus mudanjiangensis TaxID=1296538 RepID=UPI00101417BF|nr:indole-3-glycerol phosphate synthase TrpC [Lactiplantibacillus mudanjiangensis]VDG33681.1 indole-3-glycerol phosphate synthase [Lactobacillus coryniformis subsp. torquens DSM = KCTC 3535] [Lactiplantibacillus mudanjiangensis]
MILDDLVAATTARVNAAQQQQSLAELKVQVATMPTPVSFLTVLRQPGLQVIGEVKQASPSKGQIVTTFEPEKIAQAYQQAGVAAISVLTEPSYFHGSLAILKQVAATVETPVLCKDFIIESYQIYQAKLAGASAILLIVAILTPKQLRAYLALAHQLGLTALVEAHSASEIKQALAVGAQVIGVNNRNLKDFTVDLNNSIQLRSAVPADVVFVAESGIKTAADVARLTAAKVDAVLIGETLMRAPDKAAQLRALNLGRDQIATN